MAWWRLPGAGVRSAPGLGVAVTVCLVWLLAGCAAPMPKVDTGQAARLAFEQRVAVIEAASAWRLSARLGLSAEDQHWSAQLHWRFRDGRHVLDLSGPMGQGGGRLTLDGVQPALLETRAGERLLAEDPDALAARLTGREMPVSGMIYWVRGLLQPDVAHDIQLDSEGRPVRITQAGWTVEYVEYEEVDGVSLPSRINMWRDGVELKARLRGWRLGEDHAS
ncbi:MAG: lipoprotein insertase outer membrane protein LolB [Pseudomonadota bacterium]